MLVRARLRRLASVSDRIAHADIYLSLDHEVGRALADAMVAGGHVELASDAGLVTDAGVALLDGIGIDLDSIVARRGKRIRWPEPTHIPAEQVNQGGLFGETRKPWRTAREIIDWTIP